jgi:hypothetical protein
MRRTVHSYLQYPDGTLNGVWRLAFRQPHMIACSARQCFRERARIWAQMHGPVNSTGATVPPRGAGGAAPVVRRVKRKAEGDVAAE